MLGFRPESVTIGGGDIPTVFRVVEDLGSEVFVHVGVEHEGETLSIVARSRPRSPASSARTVSIRIAGAVHVFDPNGPRLTTSRIGMPSLTT